MCSPVSWAFRLNWRSPAPCCRPLRCARSMPWNRPAGSSVASGRGPVFPHDSRHRSRCQAVFRPAGLCGDRRAYLERAAAASLRDRGRRIAPPPVRQAGLHRQRGIWGTEAIRLGPDITPDDGVDRSVPSQWPHRDRFRRDRLGFPPRPASAQSPGSLSQGAARYCARQPASPAGSGRWRNRRPDIDRDPYPAGGGGRRAVPGRVETA